MRKELQNNIDRIELIQSILKKKDKYCACKHCGFTYMPFQDDDVCPNCNNDIELSKSDNKLYQNYLMDDL